VTHSRWRLLIHRIPARPLYLRARFRLALARAGAAQIKRSVYALPDRAGAAEELDRVAQEIRAAGGEAFVCEARFSDPADEQALIRSMRERSAAEYREVVASAESLGRDLGTAGRREIPPEFVRRLARLKRQLGRATALDFHGAPGRGEARASIGRLERASAARGADARRAERSPWTGRVWVTRRGVHVDRIACAWFIRRFLDPAARFRFVEPRDGAVRPSELGFDLPGGTFTHEGGGCSFETLVARTGHASPALTRIGEIVHDLDLKDGKFGHPEGAGILRLLEGILVSNADDLARIERGAVLFDDLHRSLAPPPKLAPLKKRPRRL